MIVARHFIDKLSLKEFNPGEQYPPEGHEVDEARIAELTLKGYIKDDELKEPEDENKEPEEKAEAEAETEEPKEKEKPKKSAGKKPSKKKEQ